MPSAAAAAICLYAARSALRLSRALGGALPGGLGEPRATLALGGVGDVCMVMVMLMLNWL